MKRYLPFLKTQIFDQPLAITQPRLAQIMEVLGPRILGGAIANFSEDAPEQEGSHITSEGISVIPVHGTLAHRGFGVNAMSGLTSYEQLRLEIEDAVTDPSVAGILLDIDSAGGAVSGLFELVDFIHASRGMKPIWAVANEVAFSAAFAIASAADRVILSKTAGVGSVGVLAIHLDTSEKDKASGVKFTEVFAGALKTDLSPHKPLGTEAEKRLQAHVDQIHEIFLATVSRNRDISIERVRGTDAGVFFGADAMGAGFADAIGTFKVAEEEMLVSLNRAPVEGAGVTTMSAPKADPTAAAPATPAAAPTPEPTPAADAPAVVDLDAHRAEAEGNARDTSAEIVDMCTLAGKPDLVAGFIRENATPIAVRTKLLQMRKDEGGDDINNSVSTEDEKDRLEAENYGWDRFFAVYAEA